MFDALKTFLDEIKVLITEIHQAVVPKGDINTPQQPSEVLTVAPEIDPATSVEPTEPTSEETAPEEVVETPIEEIAEPLADPSVAPSEEAPTGVLDPATSVAPTEPTA